MDNKYSSFLTMILLFLFGTVQAQISFTNTSNVLNNISGNPTEDCAVDMNGDYLDDIVRVVGGSINIDYQQADGSFTHSLFPIGAQNNPGWSICAGDIDGNGFNDLLYGGGQAVSFIYANDTGTDYTEDYHSEYIFSQRSTFSDIDNDGHLDAFVCHDVDQSHPYRNDGNGNLLLDQTLIETLDLAGNYAAIWVDYDNDGDSDLYITKCRQGSSPGDPERTNAMYRDNSDGTYTEVGAEINMDDNAQSWATVFEDFDNDGDFDAFTVNHDEQNRFKINNNGVFEEIIGTTGIAATDLGAWEAASGDFDNDGYVDILSELDNELYLNNGDLTFTGYNLNFNDGGIGDFNNDGFLDVISNNNLMLNDGNDNNWVKINTLGIISNRNGIGARVEIHGDWGIQIREVRSGQSFSPMSSLTIHFGLGQATAIDQIVIKWPSGIITTMDNPDINTTHLIPESDCLLAGSTLVVNGDTEICEGESLLIEAPAGFDSYQWSNGETTQSITVTGAGNYSVNLFDDQGCISLSNSVSVTEIIDVMPTISLQGDAIFCLGESSVISTEGGTNPVWSNGVSGQSIEVSQSGTYYVSTEGVCSTDPLQSEAITIEVLEVDLPVADDVEVVSPGGPATLTATGDNVEWYESLTATEPLYVGSPYVTPFLDMNQTYYVEAHLINGGELQDGGKPDFFGNGGAPSVGAYNYFNVYEPFTILSVTVMVPENSPTGLRDIQLVDENDIVLASMTTQSLETGQQYQIELNFEVPVGNDFTLRCPQNNLFRNSSGVNYPYPIGTVGELTTSFYGDGFYYYFYDWKIQREKVECVSDRVEVQVSMVTSADDLDKTVSSLTINPNPVSEELFINLEAIASTDMAIRLFDARGKEVMDVKEMKTVIGSNKTSINVSELPKGIYYVQFRAEGQTSGRRVVVQ